MNKHEFAICIVDAHLKMRVNRQGWNDADDRFKLYR